MTKNIIKTNLKTSDKIKLTYNGKEVEMTLGDFNTFLNANLSPSVVGDYLPLAGGTITGDLNIDGADINDANSNALIKFGAYSQNDISITSDNDAYGEGYVYVGSDYGQIGFNTNYLTTSNNECTLFFNNTRNVTANSLGVNISGSGSGGFLLIQVVK